MSIFFPLKRIKIHILNSKDLVSNHSLLKCKKIHIKSWIVVILVAMIQIKTVKMSMYINNSIFCFNGDIDTIDNYNGLEDVV